MHIANPIYDVVFKYLLDDSKLAKILISAIIGEKVISLEPTTNNVIAELKKNEELDSPPGELWIPGKLNFGIFCLDYAAVVETPGGEKKKIIIEIQKAKLAGDIMRFRYYLGSQYLDEKNTYVVREPKVLYKSAMPIVSIYFLGHQLRYTQAPVIKVARKYMDVVNNKEITKKEEFIESLTHDSFIIQIPFLKPRRRNELLTLLSIFDQDNVTVSQHLVDIKESQFPEKYRPFIRRLQKAALEPAVRVRMEKEDRMVNEFEEMECTISEMSQAIMDKDKTLEEKNKLIEEQKKLIEKLMKKGKFKTG